MPIHLPSNQSVGEEELRRKRLGKEIVLGLEPRMEHTTAGSGLEPEDRQELRDESD